MKDSELFDLIDKGFFAIHPKKIRFYAPSFMYYRTTYYASEPSDFPTISLTGKGCSLKCKHCNGILLDTMYPATTPKALFKLCKQLKEKGAKGCLMSGGCLPDGAVPLDPFVDTIAKIKCELGLTIFVHTGLVTQQTAEALRTAKVDAALIDIIGSEETIREIYNLSVPIENYAKSLSALHQIGIPFVPHVIVGLHQGMLRGEFQALEMASKYCPSAIVVIAFMPLRGTKMQQVKPPTPDNIARVLATARAMFPETPLVLGCMREKDKERTKTEILALGAGVDAIAFPTEETIKYAEGKGYDMSFSSACCSQVFVDIKE